MPSGGRCRLRRCATGEQCWRSWCLPPPCHRHATSPLTWSRSCSCRRRVRSHRARHRAAAVRAGHGAAVCPAGGRRPHLAAGAPLPGAQRSCTGCCAPGARCCLARAARGAPALGGAQAHAPRPASAPPDLPRPSCCCIPRSLLCPQAFQRSERELAAADSLFLPVSGVQLHYKRCTPTGQPRAGIGAADSCGADAAEGGGGGSGGAPPLAVHCLHGFGASAYRCGWLASCEGWLVLVVDSRWFGRRAGLLPGVAVIAARPPPPALVRPPAPSSSRAAGALYSRRWQTRCPLWSQRTTCPASASASGACGRQGGVHTRCACAAATLQPWSSRSSFSHMRALTLTLCCLTLYAAGPAAAPSTRCTGMARRRGR